MKKLLQQVWMKNKMTKKKKSLNKTLSKEEIWKPTGVRLLSLLKSLSLIQTYSEESLVMVTKHHHKFNKKEFYQLSERKIQLLRPNQELVKLEHFPQVFYRIQTQDKQKFKYPAIFFKIFTFKGNNPISNKRIS